MNIYFLSKIYWGFGWLFRALVQEFRLLPPCGNSLKLCFYNGFPSGLAIKNPPAMQEMQETQAWCLGWEDPWRREWQPAPVLLPEESHGQKSLASCSPWGHKESDTDDWACIPQRWRSFHWHPGFPSRSDSGHFWAHSAGQDYPGATSHSSFPHLRGTELENITLPCTQKERRGQALRKHCHDVTELTKNQVWNPYKGMENRFCPLLYDVNSMRRENIWTFHLFSFHTWIYCIVV